MTATPTDAERETAHEVWNEALCNSGVPGWSAVDTFAQALADQRARYEALADELEQRESNAGDEGVRRGFNRAYKTAAQRIRSVAR